jgi:glucose/arabinose dehydrogenase
MKAFRSWLLLLPVALGVAGCPRSHDGSDAGHDGGRDAGPPDEGPFDAGPVTGFCALPGSYIHNHTGVGFVGANPADAIKSDAGFDPPSVYPGPWLSLPHGFCAHHYATVPNARQLRFAPGGELFVASPTTGTTGGGANGFAAIVVVPHDNSDGVGDGLTIYKSGLESTQGIMFANGSFYFQDGTLIMSEPYTNGQRQDNGQASVVANITIYESALHWPKTLDISDNGEIYVGNGGDQDEVCQEPGNLASNMPFHGGILQLDGTPGGNPIAKGFRNPIAVKCHRDGHDHCFATELALDYSAAQGGREKLVTIRAGENWGYPCCASKDLPYSAVTVPCAGSPSSMCPPDCSSVVQDTESFIIGNTPFGFDFDDTQFPAPWDHQVIVALHGAAGSWSGARLVAIATDPATGEPVPGSDVNGGDTGGMVDFATGWDDGSFSHGRPADIEMSADGRMFVANDTNGEIFWIAPVTTH